MIYCFDIDGVICTTDSSHNYNSAQPVLDVVEDIKRLHKEQHTIILYTARGSSSGINWETLTKEQLSNWGVPHHKLLLGKPSYDLFIDDKAIGINEYRKTLPRITGLVAGSFDVLHHGYFRLFQDAKGVCNFLIVALHEDPSIDRPHKSKPLHSLEERIYNLMAIKYIDLVIPYKTETELAEIAKRHDLDVRIIGSDYKDKQDKITGPGRSTYFHERTSWSSTKMKDMLREQV
jgi:glycerol-3-phosphate cytidylyltransferase